MDIHVGEDYLTKARHLVMENTHSAADALFDQVLSNTIFSFRTNQRIFQGMIQFSDNDRWRQVFDQVLQRSRFDLPPPPTTFFRSSTSSTTWLREPSPNQPISTRSGS